LRYTSDIVLVLSLFFFCAKGLSVQFSTSGTIAAATVSNAHEIGRSGADERERSYADVAEGSGSSGDGEVFRGTPSDDGEAAGMVLALALRSGDELGLAVAPGEEMMPVLGLDPGDEVVPGFELMLGDELGL
jgi:hypothetical protein